MKYEYLVIDYGANQETAEVFDEEEAALMGAEVLLHSDVNINEVAVYKLHKLGKRQAVIKWADEEPKEPKKSKVEPPKWVNGAGQPWSQQEDTYLREARRMGMSYKGIAKVLKRSTHAVEIRHARDGRYGP